ncbi:hypothetical protein ACJROX_27175 [Pseudalkalibacillus sp. A8]|uniref:hypothetical protein n=1 Tax=Pseudalkalibacillus sp. A8 TaxID=3382641 RepID=UPI0038B4A386
MGKKLLLFIVCCYLLTGCQADDEEELIADVTPTPTHLVINNGDAFVWEQVTITIDGIYKMKVPMLPRGRSGYAYKQFRNQQGEGYKPAHFGPKRVEITIIDTRSKKTSRYVW